MYKLVVESPQFHGKSLVNQHKLVTKVCIVIIIMYIREFMFLRVRILKTGVRKGNRRDAWLNHPDPKNPESNVV